MSIIIAFNLDKLLVTETIVTPTIGKLKFKTFKKYERN